MKKILYFLAFLTIGFNANANSNLFTNSSNNVPSLFEDDMGTPLLASEAFDVDNKIVDNKLKINIVIEPKHYLYEHKIKLLVNEKPVKLNIKNSVDKVDEHYGKIKAIYDFLNLSINAGEEIQSYILTYQGCSEEFGICYPEQEVKYKKELNTSKNEENIYSEVVVANMDKENSIIEIVNNQGSVNKDNQMLELQLKINEIENNKKLEIMAEKLEALTKIINEQNKIKKSNIENVIPEVEITKQQEIKKETVKVQEKVQEKVKEKVKVQEEFKKVEMKRDLNEALKVQEEFKKVEMKRDLNEALKINEEQGFLDKYIDIDSLKKTLSDNSLFVTMAIFFIAGILISFTPCVLPMIPIISSIVVGNKDNLTQKRAFTLSFSYVLGSSLTYALIGGIAAVFSKNIQIYMQNHYVIAVFSLMLVLFALSLFGAFNIKLPNKITEKTTNISNKLSGGKHFSVFIMGMISTLIVSPCVAAPLAAAITYITTDSGDILTGALSLFCFGLGIGTVLIIITSLLNKVKISNPTIMNESKNISGTLILAVAIYMSERILPANTVIYLYEILLITYVAITFARNYEKMKKLFILFIALIVGVIYFNNKTEIDKNLFKIESIEKVESISLKYENLEKIEDLKISNQKTFIKVTADWCTYCQTMENEVFNQSEVIKGLSNYRLLKLDLTNTNADKEAIMKEMSVVAPPALFFFDNGKLAYKKIGSVDKERFIYLLNTLE